MDLWQWNSDLRAESEYLEQYPPRLMEDEKNVWSDASSLRSWEMYVGTVLRRDL